jgi:hypothetical protein
MRVVACLLTFVGVMGCSHADTAEERYERALTEHPEFHRPDRLAMFAGRVTVDGQPPKSDCKLFVILNDPSHLDATAHQKAPKIFAVCSADGSFAFTTNDPRDGVVAGKYVVTFVELHQPPKPKKTEKSGGLKARIVRGGPNRFEKPDELKNLYNDPDKNAKIENLNLDLEPPGKSDYLFDLEVAAKEPVETPGPNAVVGVTVQ